MQHLDPYFLKNLTRFDLETLEKSSYVIYGLSKDLKIIYANPAWGKFAGENGGDMETLGHYLGTPIMDAIGGNKVQEFYQSQYEKVLSTGEKWTHVYQCSSATEYREHYQQVYPLKSNNGLLIINSIAQVAPWDEQDLADNTQTEQYLQSNGYIVQCSNCRQTQNALHPERWDWVPDFIAHPPKNVSHSICPVCFDYYWKNKKK